MSKDDNRSKVSFCSTFRSSVLVITNTRGGRVLQYLFLTPYQREHNCLSWTGQAPEKGSDDSLNRK